MGGFILRTRTDPNGKGVFSLSVASLEPMVTGGGWEFGRWLGIRSPRRKPEEGSSTTRRKPPLVDGCRLVSDLGECSGRSEPRAWCWHDVKNLPATLRRVRGLLFVHMREFFSPSTDYAEELRSFGSSILPVKRFLRPRRSKAPAFCRCRWELHRTPIAGAPGACARREDGPPGSQKQSRSRTFHPSVLSTFHRRRGINRSDQKN